MIEIAVQLYAFFSFGKIEPFIMLQDRLKINRFLSILTERRQHIKLSSLACAKAWQVFTQSKIISPFQKILSNIKNRSLLFQIVSFSMPIVDFLA